MQNSDILDVTSITPAPSPAPTPLPQPPPPQSISINSSPVKEEHRPAPSPKKRGRPRTVNLPPKFEEGRIRCVCQNEDDDGFTIQCDNCLVWQHAGCVGIARYNVPETYYCDVCRLEEAELDIGSSAGAASGNFNIRKKRGNYSEVNNSTANSTLSTSIAPFLEQNILINEEAITLFRKLVLSLDEAKRQMPRIPLVNSNNLGQVDFSTCNSVVFPTMDCLKLSGKEVEVRELRNRGVGASGGGRKNITKFGVFAQEEVDPGSFIGEYIGKVISATSLTSLKPSIVQQSHLLFTSLTPTLALDARSLESSLMRNVRRSCRANCEIKIVFVEKPTTLDEAIHWCLFARNSIREGDELFLPIDYEDGNKYFKYDCACPVSELCLAITDNAPLVDVNSASATSSPTRNSISTNNSTRSGTSPKQQRKEGGNLLSSTKSDVFLQSASASSSSVSIASTTTSQHSLIPMSASASSVKLKGSSSTDRKLSREERKLQQYIEFIERMEQAEKKHHRRTSANTSGMASPPKKSSGSSPGAKRGRKPKESTIHSDQQVTNTTENEQADYMTTVKKTFADDEIMVKEDPEMASIEVDVVGITSPPPPPTSKDEDNNKKEEDTVMEGESTTPPSTPPTPPPPQPETPSKKRVSLSDYLQRRRSSPMEDHSPVNENTNGEEDGEISTTAKSVNTTSPPPRNIDDRSSSSLTASPLGQTIHRSQSVHNLNYSSRHVYPLSPSFVSRSPSFNPTPPPILHERSSSSESHRPHPPHSHYHDQRHGDRDRRDRRDWRDKDRHRRR